MTQKYLHSQSPIKIVLVSIVSALITITAMAQSNDQADADRAELKQKLQIMDLSQEQIDSANLRQIQFMRDADSNRDGTLTQVELTKTLEDRFARVDRNGDAAIGLDDAPRFGGRDRFITRVLPLIEARDTNGDEKLSFSEFSLQPLERFAEMDEDADAKVQLHGLSKTSESETTAKTL